MSSWIGGAAAIAMGLVLCACGVAPKPAPAHQPAGHPSPSASAGASPSASPAPTSSPSPAALTSCSTSQLAASLTNGQGAAGSMIYSLEFQNVSQVTCTLFGNPGVSLVTGSAGVQLGAAATFVNHATATTVTLAPNARAGAALQIAEAQNYPASLCDQTPAQGLRVYPPGQTAALFVAASGLVGCRDVDAQLLQVGPVTG